MIRKLSLALVMAMGTVPFSVNALGLGDIHLKSALNQYLDAEIDLLSVKTDEISDVRVTLATSEAYKRAGIERPFHLTKLRFKADTTAAGENYIQVTSRDPIREPFLNFLVEVNWPKGKLVREYTVLLDPPVTTGRRPAPVQSPSSSTQSRPATSMSSTSQSRSSTPAGEMAGMGEYGPTQKNDTLWQIAKKVRHEGTSMNQTMVAIQRANPQAFIKNNINNLKRGQILRIPKKDEVLELTRAKASESYRNQLAEWQGGRSGVAASTDTSQSSSGTVSSGPDKGTPKVELKIASARPVGEGEGGASEGSGEAEIQKQKAALVTAQEALESAKQEGSELNSRVEDLESQLTDLQRLLELKNNQLAQYQAALAEQDKVAEEAESEAMVSSEESTSMGEPTEEMVSEEVIPEGTGESEETTTSEEMTSAEVEETEALVGAEVVEEPVIEQSVIEEPIIEEPVVTEEVVEEPVVEVVAETTPAVEEPVTSEKKGEPNLLDTITGDTTLMAAAGGGLLVLLGLIWVAISRRRSSQDDFQESILVSTIEDPDSEQLNDLPQEPITQPTEETSFLSDFSPSDIDALQDETGEVDPLAEADVYIAYGRYQQAEELIRQAVDKDPERDGLKFKLFEILFAIKDSDNFVNLAEEGVKSGLATKDVASWNKVLEMGAQLAPSHEFFAGADSAPIASNASGEDDTVVELATEFGLDEGLDLDEISSSVDMLDAETASELDAMELSGLHDLVDEGDTGNANDDTGLEFDLDLGLDDEPVVDGDETIEVPAVDDDEDLAAFDTNINMDMPGGELPEGEVDDLADLDSDIAIDEFDVAGSMDGESVFAIDDPMENTEFEELDIQEEVSETVTDEALEPITEEEADEDSILAKELEDELDLEGLNLESDSAIAEISELVDTSDSEMLSLDDLDEDTAPVTDDELPELDSLDEVNTKLDLARAYVEMEDHQGAKEILDEVLNEGNEGQKKEAQRMLEALA